MKEQLFTSLAATESAYVGNGMRAKTCGILQKQCIRTRGPFFPPACLCAPFLEISDTWLCLYGGPEVQISLTNHSMQRHIEDHKKAFEK